MKFFRNIFPLVLFSSLLASLPPVFDQVFQPCPPTKPQEGGRIHWNFTYPLFVLLFFSLSQFLTAHAGWSRPSGVKVVLGIVGLNKTSPSV